MDPGRGGYRALARFDRLRRVVRVRRCPIALRPSGGCCQNLRLAGGGQPERMPDLPDRA